MHIHVDEPLIITMYFREAGEELGLRISGFVCGTCPEAGHREVQLRDVRLDVPGSFRHAAPTGVGGDEQWPIWQRE